MPKMDGIATTRNIRRYDSLTPIVSMTSNFTHNDIMEYIGIGMNDILPKPFSKSTLYDILEKHCAHLKIMKRQQTTTDEIIIPRGGGGLGQANITPLLDDTANNYPYNTPIADTPSTSSSSSSPTNHSPTTTSNRTTTSSSSTVTTTSTTAADSNYWQPIDNRKLVWSSSVQHKYPPQSKRQKLNDLYDPPF